MTARSLHDFPVARFGGVYSRIAGVLLPLRGAWPAAGWCVAFVAAICCGLAAPAAYAADAGVRGAVPGELRTFAVLNAPDMRNKGWQDLVENGLRLIPGVQVVDHAHLDAVAGGVPLETLIAPASVAKRREIASLLGADALVVLANRAPPKGIVPHRNGMVWATVVISDGKTGARLFVGQSVVEDPHPPRVDIPPSLAGPNDLDSVTFDAATRLRQRYPTGATCIVAAPSFANREAKHDSDYLEGRFSALLRSSLSLLPGAAVVVPEEARAFLKEQAGRPGAAGTFAPVIVDCGFSASAAPAGAAVVSAAPAAGAASPGLSVAFDVTVAGAGGKGPALRKTVPLGDVPRFLTLEVPAAILSGTALQGIALGGVAPDPARRQFEELAREGDDCSRACEFAQASAMREAALMLRPTDGREHWRLVDDYYYRSVEPISIVEMQSATTPADRERLSHRQEDAWQAGMSHLEWVIRNRQARRPLVLQVLSKYRGQYRAAIPDGPPPLRRFFTEVYPLVLGLEPGTAADHLARARTAATQPGAEPTSPEQLDAMERSDWIYLFFGLAAEQVPNGPGGPLTSDRGAPGVLSDDAADLLAGMIEKWFPADLFLPPSAGHVFERVPGSDTLAYLAGPPSANGSSSSARAGIPAAEGQTRAALDAKRQATYLRFLDRVERAHKSPYIYWVRLSRLRMQCMKERNSAPQASGASQQQIELLQRDYQAIEFRGRGPEPTDPFLLAMGRLRQLATGSRPAASSTAAATASPVMALPGAAPAKETASRLWYVPMPLRMVALDGAQPSQQGTQPTPVRDSARPQRQHPRNNPGGNGPPSQQVSNGLVRFRLVDGGPALDLLWTPEQVYFWNQADVAEEVFNKDAAIANLAVESRQPMNFNIFDVQWDGKRAWVAYTLQVNADNGLLEFPSGLAIIEADGKTIQWVGKDDGLPPGEHGMLLHPIAPGRIVAVGAFGENNRAWCATVETAQFGRRPPVKVFHTAVKVPAPPAPDADPGAEPDHDAHTVFIPNWLAECRPAMAADAGQAPSTGSGQAPRLLLVGRDSDAVRWPLVIDLGSLEVSVTAAPFGQEGFHRAIWAFTGGADTLLEIHDSSLFRWALSWDGSRLSGKPILLLDYYDMAPAFGQRFQAVSDSAYIAVSRGRNNVDYWMRYDLKAHRSETLEPDVLVRASSLCGSYGSSSRFGLMGLGGRIYRLVAAPQRPANALRRKLKATAYGAMATFEAEDPGTLPASPEANAFAAAAAAATLPPELARPVRPGRGPDDLMAEMRPDNRSLSKVASELAGLRPEAFPPEKRKEIALALVAMLTNRGPAVMPALKAFAVWHAPDAVPGLLAHVDEPDPIVHSAVMQALGMCRDASTIPALAGHLRTDPGTATGALIAIGGPAAERALLESFQSSMPTEQERLTIDALALIGTRNSIPTLTSLLERKPPLPPELAEIVRQDVEMIQKRER